MKFVELGDKSWTKIPVLHMAGRVMPGGKSSSSISSHDAIS